MCLSLCGAFPFVCCAGQCESACVVVFDSVCCQWLFAGWVGVCVSVLCVSLLISKCPFAPGVSVLKCAGICVVDFEFCVELCLSALTIEFHCCVSLGLCVHVMTLWVICSVKCCCGMWVSALWYVGVEKHTRTHTHIYISLAASLDLILTVSLSVALSLLHPLFLSIISALSSGQSTLN